MKILVFCLLAVVTAVVVTMVDRFNCQRSAEQWRTEYRYTLYVGCELYQQRTGKWVTPNNVGLIPPRTAE